MAVNLWKENSNKRNYVVDMKIGWDATTVPRYIHKKKTTANDNSNNSNTESVEDCVEEGTSALENGSDNTTREYIIVTLLTPTRIRDEESNEVV